MAVGTVRGLEVIDSELQLLVAVRAAIRDEGTEPGPRQIDDLLDERAALMRGKSG